MKESFMQPVSSNSTALPWLVDSVALEKQKAAGWVKALRITGADIFSQTGLPTSDWEGWRHTNLRPMADVKFRYSTEAVKFDVKKIPQKLLEGSGRIVLVNGQYQPHLSDPPAGVSVMSLMEAADGKIEGLDQHLVSVGDLRTTPFKALNTAYLRDGIVMRVKEGVDVPKPLEILFYNTANKLGVTPAIYPRMLYWLGENSGLTLLERHTGEGTYLANSVSEIVQESASRLRFYKFEEESSSAFHFSFTVMKQQKNAVFEGFNCATGGRIVRQEHQNLLIDSEILCSIGGVYLLKDQQNYNFTILTDHFEPNGKSVQHFKGVIDDQARAVFQGKIHVRRSAQKTDGNQLNHALLLSEKAEASSEPKLEIYADDVKCSHGATFGKLDDDALFYLRSRGIPEEEARVLLIQAFLNEALEQVSFLPARRIYQERVRVWLAS